jgi:hypothetical protein
MAGGSCAGWKTPWPPGDTGGLCDAAEPRGHAHCQPGGVAPVAVPRQARPPRGGRILTRYLRAGASPRGAKSRGGRSLQHALVARTPAVGSWGIWRGAAPGRGHAPNFLLCNTPAASRLNHLATSLLTAPLRSRRAIWSSPRRAQAWGSRSTRRRLEAHRSLKGSWTGFTR